jgi:hypothetical protein
MKYEPNHRQLVKAGIDDVLVSLSRFLLPYLSRPVLTQTHTGEGGVWAKRGDPGENFHDHSARNA